MREWECAAGGDGGNLHRREIDTHSYSCAIDYYRAVAAVP